ncbi:rhodanese-like domain-containing protein [Sulfurisoma sediminicola]|uniref:Rhodanese-related sulfurtransferase n=1 Tax=Sulfurisoma sediminicola TaxID=1381557 RepID=A0A497XCZ7_9PROT|nr:rhodanese-like domain-containing protein [Sulfurisoma sediminicola]RLJ64852.1 rhodanese-related sulfurtransferase [Sulfurisoma sediminicola]
MSKGLAPFLVIALLLPAATWAQNYPPSVTELVAKARKQVKTIDAKTFKATLDKKGAGLIVDVREPAEFADGHVPGAINLPRGQIEFKVWPHLGHPENLDTRKKITVYCSTGSRSILATKALQDLKLGNVTAVDMKWEEWTKAKYPVVTE